jgi:hypothetical protein
MPDSLREVSIDYLTGLELDAGCADPDAIRMAVPLSTELPKKPGCSAAAVPGFVERLGERLRAIIPR